MSMWKSVRRYLTDVKKKVLHRPIGMKEFGWNSAIIRAREVRGRAHISVGSRCLIQPGCSLWALTNYEGDRFNPSIAIGDDVYIGPGSVVTAIDSISIGKGCVFSERVYITDFFHGFDPQAGLILKQKLQSKGPVVIGSNCFIGFRAAVMPGVTLGDHCVVGTNSVVTRSFPAYSMLAGSPAKVVKVYSDEAGEWVRPESRMAER